MTIGLGIFSLEFFSLFDNGFLGWSWSVQVEGHCDGPDAVGWGVFVDGVLSVSTWSVSGRLLKSWLEDLVDPELLWIHASLTAVVENVIDGVVLLERLLA